MNTEDSEFERIEAEAKRRAAQDDDDDTQGYASNFALAEAYRCGYSAGAVAEQAEPPPEWEGIKKIREEYGLQAINCAGEWKAASKQGRRVVDAIEAAHGIKETEK